MTTHAKIAVAAGAVIIVAVVVGFLALRGGNGAEVAPMLREFADTGEAIPLEEQPDVGEVALDRSADGLTAEIEMDGLLPGGVYTFWFVVKQGEDPQFPNDIFVNDGIGMVAGDDGAASLTMRSSTGDPSIPGFYVEELGGVAEFDQLTDPENADVRVEVVYHGQADVAGDDIDVWLSDFWTGDPEVCANPLGTLGTGAVPDHPYCAGYWAASFGSRESGRAVS
jgi:hypothetical protein